MCSVPKAHNVTAQGVALTVPHKSSADNADFRAAILFRQGESGRSLVFLPEGAAVITKTESVHTMTVSLCWCRTHRRWI